jgi:hypothetical protein
MEEISPSFYTQARVVQIDGCLLEGCTHVASADECLAVIMTTVKRSPGDVTVSLKLNKMKIHELRSEMEGPLRNRHQVHFSAASPVWEHWHHITSTGKYSKVAKSASQCMLREILDKVAQGFVLMGMKYSFSRLQRSGSRVNQPRINDAWCRSIGVAD